MCRRSGVPCCEGPDTESAALQVRTCPHTYRGDMRSFAAPMQLDMSATERSSKLKIWDLQEEPLFSQKPLSPRLRCCFICWEPVASTEAAHVANRAEGTKHCTCELRPLALHRRGPNA